MEKDNGIVNIHGKEYQTVAYRVSKFREAHAGHTIMTELIDRTADDVVMKASILDEDGRLIATGYAEEKRSSSHINKTSALENAETSAIGRALAAFGMGGTEYATADEVVNAIKQQEEAKKGSNRPWFNDPDLQRNMDKFTAELDAGVTHDEILNNVLKHYKVSKKMEMKILGIGKAA